MKKITILFLSLMLVFVLVACGGNGSTDTDTDADTDTDTNIIKPVDTNDNTNVDSGSDAEASDTNSDNQDSSTNDSDADSNDSNDSNQSSDTDTDVTNPSSSTSSVEEIMKNEMTVFDKDEYGNEGNVLGYTITYQVNLANQAFNVQYKIDKGGEYRLYGKSTNGGIYVNAPDQNVVLVLDGIELSSKYNYPAIYAEDCKSLTIVLKDGTKSILSDTANNDGENAVIRVRSCNLTISGKGTLEITANSKYGIANTKELTINSGNINITSPSHAIFGKLGVNINGGKFNLESSGKSGIKSGDADDKDGAVTGYININAASTTIKCETNGINCYGPVNINDGRIAVDAKAGNGIDANDNVVINGGTLILSSFKSAISTPSNVTVGGSANLKLVTSGNGISANDVIISTDGVIYIKTTARYEVAAEDTPVEKTFVLYNDEYVKYDPDVHGIHKTYYVRVDCRGIEAEGKISISNGVIGINSHEDAFNVNNELDVNVNMLEVTGGRIVLSTLGDAVDAEGIVISANANIKVLGCEKGLKANAVEVDGGTLEIAAEKDSINAQTTTINGGTLYLFEKIDLGTAGTVSVNGGTVLIVCTNNSAQVTEGNAKYVSGAVTNKELAVKDAWIKVSTGVDESILIQLPKDYVDKMVVYYSSATIGNIIMVEIGSCSSDGEFVPQATENIQ